MMRTFVRPTADDCRAPIDAELHLIIQSAVLGAGRHSLHPGDRQLAAGIATDVLKSIRAARYVILQGAPGPTAPVSVDPRMVSSAEMVTGE